MKFATYTLGLLALLHVICFAQAAELPPAAETRASFSAPIARTSGFAMDEPIDPRASTATAAVDTRPANPRQAALLSIGKEYRLGPNDLLDVEVLDVENGKRTVRVNAAGLISLPLVGSVVVAGLSANEAEALIARLYREKYLQNPQVSVFVKEFTTQHITVEGAVMKPGIYPLAGRLTLLRALALAGGFGQIANSSEVMLFRSDADGARQVAVFDVDQIRSGKTEDPVIRGEDLIVVQRDASRKLFKDSLFRDILDSVNPFSVFGR
jgi:polysaccharide export outer membrane protein